MITITLQQGTKDQGHMRTSKLFEVFSLLHVIIGYQLGIGELTG